MTLAADPDLVSEALAFEAPYLIEKLVKDRIADSHTEAEALFMEVKRFICLVRTDDQKLYDMYSRRVDEAWHQFILFTSEYIEYSLRFFGSYIQHSPGNAPQLVEAQALDLSPPASFPDFCRGYEERFGIQLPDVWYDERSVEPGRRILNDNVAMLGLRDDADMVSLVNDAGDPLLSTSELARPALEFIVMTGAFYVRELPGGLTDDEKVAVVATLVQYGLLRVAP